MFFRRSKTKPGEGQDVVDRGHDHDGHDDETPLPQRLSPRSPSEAIKPIAAPPPPERPERERGSFIGLVSGLLTFAVAAALAAMVTLTIYQRNVQEPGPLAADKVVVIPRSSGTTEIAETLAKEGVIQHTGLFEFAARFGGRPRSGPANTCSRPMPASARPWTPWPPAGRSSTRSPSPRG